MMRFESKAVISIVVLWKDVGVGGGAVARDGAVVDL
jgi:hypothetical protein